MASMRPEVDPNGWPRPTNTQLCDVLNSKLGKMQKLRTPSYTMPRARSVRLFLWNIQCLFANVGLSKVFNEGVPCNRIDRPSNQYWQNRCVPFSSPQPWFKIQLVEASSDDRLGIFHRQHRLASARPRSAVGTAPLASGRGYNHQ